MTAETCRFCLFKIRTCIAEWDSLVRNGIAEWDSLIRNGIAEWDPLVGNGIAEWDSLVGNGICCFFFYIRHWVLTEKYLQSENRVGTVAISITILALIRGEHLQVVPQLSFQRTNKFINNTIKQISRVLLVGKLKLLNQIVCVSDEDENRRVILPSQLWISY
ncbi:hypothetical protein H4Q26_011549 [Puccinia striiformis f. sp. tritici PST-130]|nr:hypothetical protein H4Q26_011549 [Puccinia striiformis f. sp. tritici PST-130]